MKFSDRLRKLRTDHGYTQQQVADMLGVNKTTYSHYELGNRQPNVDKLEKLARFYHLTDELLGVINYKNRRN